MSRSATTSLLFLVGAVFLGLLLVDGQRQRQYEGFANVDAKTLNNIKLYLNDIQYMRGRSLVAFYVALAVMRTRRLRADADTRLQKDINAELNSQIAERSRWKGFEVWVKSCNETQGTPFENNYLERTLSLPDDPLLYIRFVNSLGTLYREELAALKKEAAPAWTQKEIDDGTARENYEPPPAKPKAIDGNMESYLSSHYKAMLALWPDVEKKAVALKDQEAKINELLAVRERAPNGFTMRSYVLFEEKNFMKPLVDVLKFIMDALAASLQYDKEGKKIYTIDEANTLARKRMIKESGIDFSSWFVPMVSGKKLSYKERFALMTFDPAIYNRLLGWSYTFLKTTLNQLKDSVQPVGGGEAVDKFMNFDGHVEGNYASYVDGFGLMNLAQANVHSAYREGFADAGVSAEADKGTEEENRPLEGPTKNTLYTRFAALNAAEPDFSGALKATNDIIAEYKRFKKDIEDGKYTLKAPAADTAKLA